MKIACKTGIILVALLVTSMTARAWHLSGQVKCVNGSTFNNVIVKVNGLSCLGAFAGEASTDSEGLYYMDLPDCDGSFIATIDANSLPLDATITSPATGTAVFDTSGATEADKSEVVDWLIDSAVCGQAACWFTGGGTKIDSILRIPVAEKGTKNSFGGNVNPGCSPTAGAGGNWNHIARDLKLHFQGKSIQVVNCGNVTPPPDPGSSSPKTPFNFLECVGTGTLKGIQGNKANYGTVTFFARFEDRNEPGSKNANAGALIDRYFLKVVDGGGTKRLLIDANGVDDGNVDPGEITTGNFQIHISSCDNPPTP